MSVQDRIDFMTQARVDTENGSGFAMSIAQQLEDIAAEMSRELAGSRSGEEAAQAVDMAAKELRSISAELSNAASDMGNYLNALRS